MAEVKPYKKSRKGTQAQLNIPEPYRPEMQKVVIGEWFDLSCQYCQEAYEHMMTGTRISLAEGEALVIRPSYNSNGHLTHYHMEILKRGQKV